MSTIPSTTKNTRLGFHYFPDSTHYRSTNLRAWLPELLALGASWIVLSNPSNRSIPESFITELLENNIQPIVLIKQSISELIQNGNHTTLFPTYARWGVKYIVLCEKPNSQRFWGASDWSQNGLVERFLDAYLPQALIALDSGLIPIFPPLQPKGDYWDTSFLNAALKSIKRRGHYHLLSNLVVGAYAQSNHPKLDWGSGGPERWPRAKPYTSISGSEDHAGFHIFDWYIPIIENVTKKSASMILFEAGTPIQIPGSKGNSITNPENHTQRNLAFIKSVISSNNPDRTNIKNNASGLELKPIPPQVLACNFWLLADSPNSPNAIDAWYKPDGSTLPIVHALQKLIGENTLVRIDGSNKKSPSSTTKNHTISHYLLIPIFSSGVLDWHLEMIRPFVKQHRPTIGFSVEEASQAARVTVVGGVNAFSATDLEKLNTAGCLIDYISRDGTSIATI